MTPELALNQYFGYKTFRPSQLEIIETLLEKRDVLALMPTGGGKSLCFQIPAIISEGIAIVVSPLIALMKDQVEGLLQNGIKAAFINSTQTADEQKKIARDCNTGEIKLLYISPERLQTENFRIFIEQLPITLFAIDEAHCISFWGHDFRPDYKHLAWIKQRFPYIPVIALTATADKLTRQDIITQLGLKNPAVFSRSFDRPNLSIDVQPALDRVKEIIRFIERRPRESGIIYCLSRAGTESLADKLQAKGIKAQAYHAGLDNARRSKVQNDFIKDNINVVVATIAFGMGIDKPNVRYVIHYNLPKNIESYYQEIGRAGRDGLPSNTILYYAFNDLKIWHDMIMEEGETEMRDVKLAKLERLQQFAEGHTCRRRVLLQYFGETIEKPCNNCDICSNPRRTFDGTIIAQKALSAVARSQEQAGLGTVIDILRGLHNANIVSKGFDKIKTFGAGREYTQPQWQSYISQLINQGYLEIAYDRHSALTLTDSSKKVLFDGEKVQLVQVEKFFTARETTKPKSKVEVLTDMLFEKLRTLRKTLADQQNIPPYQVFNDDTLKELSKEYPTTREKLAGITGMSSRKLAMYGKDFLDEIIQFIATEGQSLKGATYTVTWYLYTQNHAPETIAKKRELSVATIYSHFAKLYEEGYDIEIDRVLSTKEMDEIGQAILKHKGADGSITQVVLALGERHPYHKVKLVDVILKK